MILFDHQIFFNQRYGGISLMFSEIMNYLTEKKEDFVLPIKYTENANLLNKPYYKPTQYYFNFTFPRRESWLFSHKFLDKLKIYSMAMRFHTIYKRIIYLRNKPLVIEALKEKQIRVFHPTYFDNYFLDTVANHHTPFILTVYDLIHEKLSDFFHNKDVVVKNRYQLCSRAELIIAISESTKNDLVEIYNIDPKKIKVIHLSSSLKKNLLEPTSNFPYKDFILFVGDRWHYKNFKNFLQSVAPLVKKHKAIVVSVGSHPFNKDEEKFMESLGIRSNIIHVPFTTESDLASLYANARLFVFPSLYEGFGIPLLEAMSFNCPVVCSNTSSFPEVVADAANMFNPLSVESMTDSIQKTFESETLRSQLIERGKERAKLFSWEKCGEEHLKVYKEF